MGVRLVETERDFEGDQDGNGLAVRACDWLAAPGAHGIGGGFIEAQTGALDNAGICDAPIHGDDRFNQYNSRIFCFARFVGIGWIGHVEASGETHTVHTRPKNTAAGAAAFAGTQAPTRTGTYARAVPMPERIARTGCQGIAETRKTGCNL